MVGVTEFATAWTCAWSNRIKVYSYIAYSRRGFPISLPIAKSAAFRRRSDARFSIETGNARTRDVDYWKATSIPSVEEPYASQSTTRIPLRGVSKETSNLPLTTSRHSALGTRL